MLHLRSPLSLLFGLLPLGACGLHQDAAGDVCTADQVVKGIAATTGAVDGSVELRSTTGDLQVSFSTAPPGQTSSSTTIAGHVRDDGSGTTTLTVNVDSSFRPYADFILPDLRAFPSGAMVSVRAEGSVAVAGGGFCNFSTDASLTILESVGAQAPSPQFVAADFVRTGELLLDTTATQGAGGPLETAPPDCNVRLLIHATVKQTAASYSTVYDNGSCASLGK